MAAPRKGAVISERPPVVSLQPDTPNDLSDSSAVDDQGIKPGEIWGRDKKRVPAPKDGRFGSLKVLPFLEQGFGVATFYYGDVDPVKYAERKPLIWFWMMYDRSPLGLNHWLGFRMRAMLARHVFKHCGKNVKIFHGVELTFGYNLTVFGTDTTCVEAVPTAH